MPQLKRSEMRFIDDVFNMSGGYPLNFSNRTFAEFFEDEIEVEIYQEKYAFRGSSKANHLRAFIEIEDGYTVGKLLRRLLAYRDLLPTSEYNAVLSDTARGRFIELIEQIENATSSHAVTALSGKAEHVNFDTVSRDLDRALESAKRDPEDSVTAACSTVESVCRSILVELNEPFPDKKDIKGLFSAVRKPLGLSPDRSDLDPLIAEDVRKILSGLSTLIEGIGALRTHGGDAHGRERGYLRIDARIARLAIHCASTAALFLIETWQRKFPSRELPRRD